MDLRLASPCAPNQEKCQGQDPKLPLAAGPPNETTRLSEGLISLAMQAYPHETDTEEQLVRSFVRQGRARYLQRHARRQRF